MNVDTVERVCLTLHALVNTRWTIDVD